MFSQQPLNPFYNPPSIPQNNTAFTGQQNPYAMQQSPSIPMQQPYYPAYKHGGEVDMQDMAEKIRQQGTGGDTVLAHINPSEQRFLEQNTGGSINPITGLPEYGRISKILKPLGRILGAVVGSYFGGPLGAMAGSSLVGSTQHSSKNRLKGALRGGLEGLGYSAIAPMLGNAFGVSPQGLMGKAMGMGHPSLLGQLGIGGASTTGGGLGIMDFLGLGGSGGASSGGGGLGALMGAGKGAGAGGSGAGGFMGMSPLTTALMAGSLGTGLMSRTKQPKERESLQEYMQRNSPSRQENIKPKKYRYKQEYAEMPENYQGMEQGERRYFTPGEFEEVPYAFGGHVGGSTGGQDDKIKAELSDGEFVHRADVVSRLGDGNTNAGFKKLYKLEDAIMSNPVQGGRKLPKKSPDVNKMLKILGV